MTTRMQIDERLVGDVAILRLVGRLELEAGDLALRDAVNRLIEEGHTRIILDMRAVTRLDSAGIGMLVSKLLSARRKGGTIKLVALTEHSHHLLDITKLSTVFEIFEDEALALQSFGPAAQI